MCRAKRTIKICFQFFNGIFSLKIWPLGPICSQTASRTQSNLFLTTWCWPHRHGNIAVSTYKIRPTTLLSGPHAKFFVYSLGSSRKIGDPNVDICYVMGVNRLPTPGTRRSGQISLKFRARSSKNPRSTGNFFQKTPPTGHSATRCWVLHFGLQWPVAILTTRSFSSVRHRQRARFDSCLVNRLVEAIPIRGSKN